MRILPNKKENAHVFLLVRAGDAIHKINFTWPKGSEILIQNKGCQIFVKENKGCQIFHPVI